MKRTSVSGGKYFNCKNRNSTVNRNGSQLVCLHVILMVILVGATKEESVISKTEINKQHRE